MCKYLLILVSLLLFSFIHHVNAQPNLEWVRLYPDTNTFGGSAIAMALNDSGNVYITGTVDSNNRVGYCTVKYSASGVQRWASKYFGPLNITYVRAIALDDSSNVYVTGYSNNPSTFFDFCTIKYNSNGVQQWIKYYDGLVNGEDIAEKVAVDNAGNIYVTGYSQFTNGLFVYTVVKYSTNGIQIWDRTYSSFASLDTHVKGIEIDDDCNIYITGSYSVKAITVKYDSTGNLLWVQEYSGVGGGGTTGANSITIDEFRNVYVAGFTGSSFFLTIKYGSSGMQEWVRRFNPDSATSGRYIANSIEVDKSGNVYSSGFFQKGQSSPRNLCLIKYSNSGYEQWIQKDTTRLATQQTYMNIDKNGNIYLASTNGLPQPYYRGIILIKYDNSGIIRWRQIYSVTSSTMAYGFKVDNLFNLYLNGGSFGKMCTIKYSQVTGIINENYNIPESYYLYQNYPNPFNISTKIKFYITKKSFVSIIIYNLLGEEIIKLINQELEAGIYEKIWDAGNYPSGIYFCRLISNVYIESRKMILIK